MKHIPDNHISLAEMCHMATPKFTSMGRYCSSTEGWGEGVQWGNWRGEQHVLQSYTSPLTLQAVVGGTWDNSARRALSTVLAQNQCSLNITTLRSWHYPQVSVPSIITRCPSWGLTLCVFFLLIVRYKRRRGENIHLVSWVALYSWGSTMELLSVLLFWLLFTNN